MTYRELLQLYKQGKLDMEKKKQVEAEIEKQDAISEFLYEEGDIPDFSDLENGEACFNNCRGCCFDICALRSFYPSESSLKILLRSKRSSRSV